MQHTKIQNIPEYFGISYIYSKAFKAVAIISSLPFFISSEIKEEDISEHPCECPCGIVHRVVSKEKVEEIIAKLAGERITLLN